MVLGGERSRSPVPVVDEFDNGAGLDAHVLCRGRSSAAAVSIATAQLADAIPTPMDSAAVELSAQLQAGSVDKFLSESFNRQIGSFKGALVPVIADALEEPIKTVVADACKAQMQAVEGRLSSLETGQKTLESGQKLLLEEVAKINKTLARMAHSPSLPDLSSTSASPASLPDLADVTASPFWRKPDPTMLFINVHGRAKVNLRTIYRSVVELATAANIPEDVYQFNGDPYDCLFDLKFTGPSAARQCLQFFQSLQLGRGRWKTQEVADSSGTMHKFYVAPDKNPAQVRKEVLAKKLKLSIEALEGWSKPIFVRKATGTLLVDRRPLLSVTITDEFSAGLVWSHANRIQQGLEQEIVEGLLKEIIEGSSP